MMVENVLDVLTEGILITDENLMITYVNPAALTYTAYLVEDLIGRNLLEIHSFKNRKEVKLIHEHFKAGTLSFWEKTIRINNRFLNLQLKAIYNAQNLEKVIVEFFDVTAVRQSKQSHENLFRMYSLMFDATQLAMVTIDKAGKVTSFNPAAEKLFSVTKAEIIRQDYINFFKDGHKFDENGNYTSQMVEALETGKEYQNLKKDIVVNGHTLTILMDTCVLRDTSGQVLGVLGVFNDITDYSLNENLAHREDKYAAMAQLAAGLADEMRNPLTSVKGFMQLLSHRMRKNRQKEYVDLALDELKRMERLIRNFLLFSSPDAPVMKLGSINRLLRDVTNDFKANFNNLNIELITPQEEFFMCLDEEQIKHVIFNLLQNAVEAIPLKEGKIFIKMIFSKNDPYISIFLEDNGRGIPEDILLRVYEPFFTTKEYNSGLGLTISRRIIEAHGGTMNGYNNNLGGVTMKVCLPFGAFVPRKSEEINI